jgi:SAM-dependent methyltransferase
MSNVKNNIPWYAEETGLFSEWYFELFGGKIGDERTSEHCDFLEKTLSLNKGAKVLDLCCGHGRITNEMAKRGYDMTGQDINNYFMGIAKKKAGELNLNIRWVNSDMRQIPFKEEFDAVVNMFTSFGYFDSDEENEKVIREVNKSLKQGGKFLIDFSHRDFVIKHYKFEDVMGIKNGYAKIKREFDYVKSSHVESIDIFINGEFVKQFLLYFRFYSVSELTAMLSRNGFKILSVYGGFNFRPLSFETNRCIILAEKI